MFLKARLGLRALLKNGWWGLVAQLVTHPLGQQ